MPLSLCDFVRINASEGAPRRRTGCFGQCLRYHVAVYRDGEVRYFGESYVATKGIAVERLSADKVSGLERQLVQSNVAALAGEYLDEDCTDLPTVYVWYRPGRGPTSFVAHYLVDA
jgi:hypothetical protein